MTNSVSSSVGRTLLRYHVAGALPCTDAPLPCGNCAPSFVSLGSCTSLGSVLVLVLRVRLRCVPHLSVLCSGSWSCLGHPQPPWRTRHGCTVGVNRDPPVCSRCPGSMASVAERQPYVRWTTTYDFKETWFIDVSSCIHFKKKKCFFLFFFFIFFLKIFFFIFHFFRIFHFVIFFIFFIFSFFPFFHVL